MYNLLSFISYYLLLPNNSNPPPPNNRPILPNFRKLITLPPCQISEN